MLRSLHRHLDAAHRAGLFNRHLFSVVAAGGTDDVDTTGVDRGLDGLLGLYVESIRSSRVSSCF